MVGILGIALATVNLSRADHCGQVSGCVDLYWANFWLVLYSDGHEKRAALGEVVRLFAGGELHYTTLNVVAMIVALLILAAVFIIFLRNLRSTAVGAIAFVGILAGPSTTVLLEALGDQLQVALLIVFAYALALRWLTAASAAAFGTLTVVVVTLIHEASLFLFLPVVYLCFAYRFSVRINAGLLAGLVGTGVLAVVLLTDDGEVRRSSIALVTQAPEPYRVSADPLPSLMHLLQTEIESYFGTPRGPLTLFLRIVGAFAWPALAATVLSIHYRDWRPLRIFGFLILFSLPLYAIARDWGRFTSYSFLSAVVVYWTATRFGGEARAAEPFRVPFESFVPASFLPYFLLFYQSHDYYRVDGLMRPNSALLLTCLALVVLNGLVGSEARRGRSRDAEREADERRLPSLDAPGARVR